MSTHEIHNSTLKPCNAEHAGSEHDTYIAAIMMLVLITGCLNLHHWLHRKNFRYLGETAIYLLVGFVVSAVWTTLEYDPLNKAIQLNSGFFSLVLLPPIIFEGGFTLQRTSFFQNIVPILGLSLLGAFYSTFVTSLLMYIFSRLITDVGWSVIESLVFGALISSTDPVTVLSLLPDNVDKRLYMLIFGESALNDAVSIILFRFFVGLQAEADNLGVAPFLVSFLASFGVFLGSFLVGAILALAFSKITKHVWIEGYEGAIYEMIMLLVFAYSSYLLAEILQLTGIISIFFCGVVMAHYAHSNLTKLTQRTLKVTLRMICTIFEGLIFLYLGLGLFSFSVVFHPLFVVAALVSIIVSRTHVFIILSLSSFLPQSKPIPMNQQVLMWFSGLRGAVAFALGVSFLENPTFDPAIKGVIFGTTVMVIVTTVLLFGGLTPYMLRWLKLVPETTEDGHEAVGASHDLIDQPPEEAEYVITEEDLEQPLFGWLYRFDVKYIRPYFTHYDEEQLKTLEVIQRRESRVALSASQLNFPLGRQRSKSVINVELETLRHAPIEQSPTAESLDAVNLD